MIFLYSEMTFGGVNMAAVGYCNKEAKSELITVVFPYRDRLRLDQVPVINLIFSKICLKFNS